MGQSRRKFIVTGCSRSGTKYISMLLSSIGYICAHEGIFNLEYLSQHGVGRNPFLDFPELDGDSSSGAPPFLELLPSDTVVLHQIRNPISTIRSHMGIKGFSDKYVPSRYLARDHVDQVMFFEGRFCPEMFQHSDELTRCMIYWVQWNRLAQQAETIKGLHYFRYRVEELELTTVRHIMSMIGDPRIEILDRDIGEALSSISRTTNTRARDISVSWKTLPEGSYKEALKLAAVEYGYRID